MSYEAVAEQVRNLPEDCLEDVSKYISFLMYRRGLDKMNSLVESDTQTTTSSQTQKNRAKETLRQIQEMFADDKGWDSEEDMLKDMADFRRKRLAECKY